MPDDDFEMGDLSDSEESEVLANQVAALEEQLAAEKDGRNEDRFIALIIIFVLVDIALLNNASNFAVPLIALIFELIVLLILAKRMGSEEVVQMLDKIIHSVSRPRGGDD